MPLSHAQFCYFWPKKKKKKRFQPNQNFKEVKYWFLKLKEVSAIRINQKDKR